MGDRVGTATPKSAIAFSMQTPQHQNMRIQLLAVFSLILTCALSAACSDTQSSKSDLDMNQDMGPTSDMTNDLSSTDAETDAEDDATIRDVGPDSDMRASTTCAPDSTGLAAPLPSCTSQSPCTNPAGQTVTVESERPSCSLALFDEIAEMEVDGVTRFACIKRAPGADQNPRPLVIFFHPGGDGVIAVESTSLIEKTATALLGADDTAGFTLVAIEGRRIRFGTAFSRDGVYHHDFYFRDIASPSTNPDIKNADLWIERMVDEGIVDTNRVYAMGWSNGGFFTQLYAIARHETGTPNLDVNIAAAVAFAAGDPFNGIDSNPFDDPDFAPETDGANCQLQSYPDSDVPILLAYRTCDTAVPCGAPDRACFGGDRGYSVDLWLQKATDEGLNVTGFMLNGAEPEHGGAQDGPGSVCSAVDARCNGEPTPSGTQCLTDLSVASTAYCQCLLNHLRWPDGDYPGGTVDREVGMLQYLRANPLTQ